LARVSQLSDTLNKIIVDDVINPKKVGERELPARLGLDRKPLKLRPIRIDLANSSGKSAPPVYQDFHAKVLTKTSSPSPFCCCKN